jgi:hypothetical protein
VGIFAPRELDITRLPVIDAPVLNAGNTMRLGISGLGEQIQRLFAWDSALLDQVGMERGMGWN